MELNENCVYRWLGDNSYMCAVTLNAVRHPRHSEWMKELLLRPLKPRKQICVGQLMLGIRRLETEGVIPLLDTELWNETMEPVKTVVDYYRLQCEACSCLLRLEEKISIGKSKSVPKKPCLISDGEWRLNVTNN